MKRCDAASGTGRRSLHSVAFLSAIRLHLSLVPSVFTERLPATLYDVAVSVRSQHAQCFSGAGKSSITAMTLDKIHVAGRQLGVALALFLEDLDPIVVHVLACTAGEVAEYLAVKATGQPFTARALATFRNNSWRDIRRARNQFWSSFRYATTHDDDRGATAA
jgi:hypothetical protein